MGIQLNSFKFLRRGEFKISSNGCKDKYSSLLLYGSAGICQYGVHVYVLAHSGEFSWGKILCINFTQAVKFTKFLIPAIWYVY